jgi:hypothetical protein
VCRYCGFRFESGPASENVERGAQQLPANWSDAVKEEPVDAKTIRVIGPTQAVGCPWCGSHLYRKPTFAMKLKYQVSSAGGALAKGMAKPRVFC